MAFVYRCEPQEIHGKPTILDKIISVKSLPAMKERDRESTKWKRFVKTRKVYWQEAG